jgi:hypothetical protein
VAAYRQRWAARGAQKVSQNPEPCCDEQLNQKYSKMEHADL